jgi:hypothetical protein
VASQPIERGWIYAFDKQGKTLWPEPVLVENQFFQPEQPSRVPVLTFACQEYVPGHNMPQNQILLLCVDKRTGRKVYDKGLASSTGTFDVVGNPQQHSVELRLQQTTITLAFTDKPLPPSPAEGDKGTNEAGQLDPIRAIWKAVEKAISPADRPRY